MNDIYKIYHTKQTKYHKHELKFRWQRTNVSNITLILIIVSQFWTESYV